MDEAWFNEWVQELRAFTSEMAASRRDHAQRLGQHDTQMQALYALLASQDERITQGEETLRRLAALEERLNNPLGNGRDAR